MRVADGRQWLIGSHSLAGVHDMKKETVVEGAVTTIKFSNPHGSLSLGVKNPDGTTTEWVMTLGFLVNPSRLAAGHAAILDSANDR